MKTRNLVRIAIFSALTAALSQLVIPIGPVPISLGTFAVYISAAFLSPKNAFISQVVYLILGVIGLPVFSNFGTGIAHLLGPTGGFALSYPFVALISALVISSVKGDLGVGNYFVIFSGYTVATVICYTFGIVWFSYVVDMTIKEALPLVCYPFIPGDLIKIAISIVIYSRLKDLEIFSK